MTAGGSTPPAEEHVVRTALLTRIARAIYAQQPDASIEDWDWLSPSHQDPFLRTAVILLDTVGEPFLAALKPEDHYESRH